MNNSSQPPKHLLDPLEQRSVRPAALSPRATAAFLIGELPRLAAQAKVQAADLVAADVVASRPPELVCSAHDSTFDATRLYNLISALGEAALPLLVDGNDYVLGASAGSASFPADGQTADALVRRADLAMYEAKRAGRARVVAYRADMEARAVARVALEQSVRTALETGQFCLHYQPKARVRDLSLYGAEALLRWNHPQMGLVALAAFLEVADECGLMPEIDRWLVAHGIAEIARMRAQGLDCPIALNVTAQTIATTAIVEHLREQLTLHAVPAESVEIEITESGMMRDVEASRAVLEQLRDLGVRVRIDDFGTGYSSMAYLMRFPVDALKIDSSFVANLPDDGGSAQIIRGMVALAHSLGMRVVAEGVENAAQLRALRGLECDLLEGFMYSRPIAFDDFVVFCGAHRRVVTVPENLFGRV